MDDLDSERVEWYRLQVLVFILRRSRKEVRTTTAWDLSHWLRTPVDECVELVDELVDDGLLVAPTGLNRMAAPLTLTELGLGCVMWAQSRGE